MKSEQTKEFIIEHTITLINESQGNINEITIRKIASRAGVGVGLINHYFMSKEQLIETCVQRIINKVVYSFGIKDFDSLSPKERTMLIATQVVEFLMENQSISKVSILGDMRESRLKDNSYATALGFAYCMAPNNTDYKAYMKKAYFLVSILQNSFLRKDTLKDMIDVDFYESSKRNKYIGEIVNMIMGE